MSFHDRWQETLVALKAAFLQHIEKRTTSSQKSLDQEVGKFTVFVRTNQGVLNSLPAAHKLLEKWNRWVASVRSPGSLDVTTATEGLLGAIDEALGDSVNTSEANSPGGPVIYNIDISNVVGPVNVLSRLDDVVQAVNQSPALDDSAKVSLAALFGELRTALEAAPASSAGDTDLLLEQAEAVAAELKQPTPRAAALKIKAKGLLEAADTLKTVVPTAVDIARRIAEFVTSPISA